MNTGALNTAKPKHLVLLGAGLAHVHLMARLAKRPLQGIRVTLISSRSHWFDATLVPRFVAGLGTVEECCIALEPLAQQGQVRWVRRNAMDVNPQTKVMLMDDGSELPFDWLSIDTEPVQPRDKIQLAMPGARENVLFTRPLEAFCNLWPRVTGLGQDGAIRVTVICDGFEAGQDFGMELAMAVRKRLPHAAVTLVTGGARLAASHPPVVQAFWAKALRVRRITVLVDQASGVARGEVLLGSGARLACDVPILATRGQLPAWLGRCGLAMDDGGAIAIDACQRSTSHPHVFAPAPGHPAAAKLLANLTTVMAGLEPKPRRAIAEGLNILACSDGKAIAAWGAHAAHGRLLGWLKYSVDRIRIAKYRTPGDPHETRYTTNP